MRYVPPEVVVYMTWMSIYTAPNRPQVVHPLEELYIVCFQGEESKGVLHGVEMQQLGVTDR